MVLPVLLIMLLPLLLAHCYNPPLVIQVTHKLLDLLIPNLFSPQEEGRFQKRYAEDYDLFDPKYASRIEINHPENSYRSAELHTDTSVPSLADMYSHIPPSEHVETMASVNLFPTFSIYDSPNSEICSVSNEIGNASFDCSLPHTSDTTESSTLK